MLGWSLAFAIAGGVFAQIPPPPTPDANALEAQIASALKQGDAILAQPDVNPAEALPFYQSAWDLASQLIKLDRSRSAAAIEPGNRLGELWLTLGDPTKGYFRAVLSIRESLLKELAQEDPYTPWLRTELEQIKTKLAELRQAAPATPGKP
jgi:hypothetical protein